LLLLQWDVHYTAMPEDNGTPAGSTAQTSGGSFWLFGQFFMAKYDQYYSSSHTIGEVI
jgi:hypothetical protein